MNQTIKNQNSNDQAGGYERRTVWVYTSWSKLFATQSLVWVLRKSPILSLLWTKKTSSADRWTNLVKIAISRTWVCGRGGLKSPEAMIFSVVCITASRKTAHPGRSIRPIAKKRNHVCNEWVMNKSRNCFAERRCHPYTATSELKSPTSNK